MEVAAAAREILPLDTVLSRYGPDVVPSFEHQYCPVVVRVRTSSRSAGDVPALCVLGAGTHGIAIIVVPRARPYWSEAVVAKIQYPPVSVGAWPSDAATVFDREYSCVVSRLQPEHAAVGGAAAAAAEPAAASMPTHPHIVSVLGCFVEKEGEHHVRMVTITELAGISPDMKEVSYKLLPAGLLPLLTDLPDAAPAPADVAGAAASAAVGAAASSTVVAAAGGLQRFALDFLLNPAAPGRLTHKMLHGGIKDVHDASNSCTLLFHAQVPLPASNFVCACIALQVLLALRHMHSHGMYHRDVKPDNIVVAGMVSITRRDGRRVLVPQVNLIDMGLARPVDPTPFQAVLASQHAGSEEYMAPELTVAGGNYDGRADAFTVGTTTFALMTCGLPVKNGVLGFPRRFEGVVGRCKNATGAFVKCDALATYFRDETSHRQWLQEATVRDVVARSTVDELIGSPWLEEACSTLPDAFRAAGVWTQAQIDDLNAAMLAAAAAAATRRLNGHHGIPLAAPSAGNVESLRAAYERRDAAVAELRRVVTDDEVQRRLTNLQLKTS